MNKTLSNALLKVSVASAALVGTSAFANETATDPVTGLLATVDTSTFLAGIGAAGAVLITLNLAKTGIMKVIGMVSGGAR